MASTTLTGDRRWASTRKSGMTVLGKVPKPINLPSQRLENHGLDPNVEIVPKGTLTWGSRSSTAVPNAWASSTLLSPNTDGSSGSPNHVNGRPSSGSGTRPSTSGSDRSHEPTSNAWGPNSRPSSASGILVSNQTSIVANRPQSAETRPSSTQLSRFAEIPVESTGAWGPTRTAERAGPALLKTNDFSLSSGDFPTLGSEKNSDSLMQRGHSSHGRPGSASGTAATQKEAARSLSAGEGNEEKQHDHGNVNIWKPDDYPYVGCAPSNTTWQRDPQQAPPYPIGNIPPQPFGPWHNAPIHSPDGVWYRGGAVGGPYRPAGPSGSYLMEPYAYYPQFPARPLLSSEPVPRPGSGQDGCQPKNEELYQHHYQPDSYMVPSHPVRPGVYPGTLHEGYYGPPHASFCNSNEREVPISGMPDQSGACNHHPYQTANLDPGKFLAVSSGNASVMAKEQKDSNHAPETCPGQYRVLLKQHSGLEDKNDAQKKRGQSVVANLPQIDRGILQGTTTQEEDWRRNNKKDESMFVKLASGRESLSHPTRDQKGHPTDPVITKSLVNASNEAGDSLLRRPENATFRVQDLPQNPVMKKDTSLIVKIEGLNNKMRSADGHSGGDEKMKHFKVANKAEHSTKAFSTKAASTEYAPTTGAATFVSGELGSSTGNRNLISFSDEMVSPRLSESLAFEVGKSDSSEVCEISRSQALNGAHILQDRIDDHAKLRSSSHDDDELIKKSPGRDTSVLATLTNAGKDPGVCLLECHASKDVAEESHHMANTSGASYSTSNMDSMDHKAQRAKLKEIAMRRAKELQEEEEERTREQKAKALAKLEELNRRTLAQSSNQKNYDVPPSNDVQHKKAEDEQTSEEKEKGLAIHDDALPSDTVHYSRAGTAGKIDAIITDAPGLTSTPNSDSMAQANVTGIKILVGITDLSPGISSDVSVSATHDSAIPNDSSPSLGREKITTEAATQLVCSVPQESNVSKQKQMGFRKRPNISEVENLSEKPTTAESTVSPKISAEVAIPTLSSDSSSKEETPVHHRKRNSRHAKNKNRLDEAITVSASPISAPTMGNLEKGLVGSGGSKPLTSEAEANPDPAQSFSETIVNQGSISSSDQGLPQVTEKVYGRVGNQWKPQFTRKSRNQLAIRPLDRFHGSEAVIWAPVRPSNRNELSGEVNQKSTSETNNHASGKNGHDVQGGMKIKRAEMERYVPKPVAKELSQHENFQEPSLPLDQAVSCNMTRKPDSGSNSLECGKVVGSAPGKPELSTDMKNREINKPNRRGKMHASWRQRSSVKSSSQSSSLSGASDLTKPMPDSSDKNQPSDSASSPERQFQHDDWGSSSGNLMPTENIVIPAVIKDMGEPSRQGHLQFVVQTVEGSNCAPIDNKDMHSGRGDKIDAQSPVLDLNEAGRRSVPRTKNQNVGEYMKSQWQPKSQAYSHNYHCESRGDGEQKIALQGVRLDKESHSQSVKNYPLQNEYNSSPAPRISDAERLNARHKETNRENAIVQQSKEKSCPTNKKLPTNSGVASVDVSVRHEQPVSSAPRRQGHHNDCFGRGHEATFRDRNLGEDAGKQILHTNGDKRRSNSHFEYQRIGSYNKSSELFKQNPVIGEEAPEGPQAPGLRYRERGQHRSRHGGHSYSQRSGAPVQVADSCNSGE